MSKNNHWASRVVCLGLFAMLALVVLAAVLAPVMLAASVSPRARRGGGGIRGTSGTAGTPRDVQRGAGMGLPEGGYAGGEGSDGRRFEPVAKLATAGADDER
jgi:uncharacterized membrane protein